MRTASRAPLVWWLLGLAAFVLLPWYLPQEQSLVAALPGIFGGADSAAGAVQALRHHRPWLWVLPLALAGAGLALRMAPGSRQGRVLVVSAGCGLAVLLVTGFAIGAKGWAFAALEAWFGAAPGTQFGLGPGGAVALLALLMLLAIGSARLGAFRGDVFVSCAVLLCAALLLLFVALPVGKALLGAAVDDAGAWSLRAGLERVSGERVWGLGCLAGGARCGVAWNTLFLALLTAAGTTVLGTLIALLAERGSRRFARPLQVLALLPIVTPPFVVGLGLILLFGRAGLVNQALEWAFGVTPSRWFYGLLGIWLAQMFAFTPVAFMIMRGVVQGVSPTLEEAAQTLRADRAATFRTVTLPLLTPGLANAFLVGFIESMADFGNPIVVGGPYNVLSTDIFFAIVGAQFDQGRAAALALLLTAFALAVFVIQQRVLGRARYTTVGGKGDTGVPMPLPSAVQRLCSGVALPWLTFTLVIYVFAFVGGFVRTWGRDYTPTLAHFVTAFDLQRGEHGLVWAGTAWNSLFTTVELAALAAPLTAAIGLLIAWLLARTQFVGQRAFEFGALLAFAIPGTVLGVSYILAFNVPPFELTGTALIIVLCFMFRNLPVGVRAGAAAFEQIDRSLDEASTMLHAGTATTLRRVVLPLLKPALAAALVYSFVRAMTTVSAVIFLVTAENELATTYIIGRVGNGDYGVALAYCSVLIVAMALATAAIQLAVGERRLGRRADV
ncbi:MAG: iron ABC transporter permease [Ideonella sp.]|nr:iron ABC transporter permease [Ideonella sp.]MCC7456244.1 iron ABC transporter permease [Nitrospira sp.]